MLEIIQNGLFVLGAWVFWGTYPAPFKSQAAIKADTDPFAFQCMKSICVFLTSWLVLTWKEFTFTYWGIVGAALWIPSGLLYITSIKLTGVAFAAPIANGCQVIVSFCWGAFYFKEEVKSPGLAVLAMFVMLLGMVGVSYAVNYEKLIRKQATEKLSINVTVSASEQDPLLAKEQLHQKYLQDEEQPAPPQQPAPNGSTKLSKAEERRNTILGIICALCSGFFGATQNVPLKNAPPKAHGILYVISFGIGAVIISFSYTLVYVIIRLIMKKGLPKVNLRLSAVPGTMAGVLWSGGNICNIYATLALGATVGFPLVLCNLMVAGMWGVFFYNEAPRLIMKLLFMLSCATILGGVVILSLYG